MELNEHIGEEEWEDFQPDQVLSPELSGKLWNGIHKNTAAPSGRHGYFRWMAVAASVLAVAGLSWYFIVKDQRVTAAGTVALMKHISNPTSQKMTLTLSDGSTVELAPNSELSYAENFSAANRDVLLNGEAVFNVTKDAARPFSVYSNSVLVTVLGTRFTVRPNEGNGGTKVILHQGSVMVKTPSSREYYLSAGDVFISKKVNAPSRINNTAPTAISAAGSKDSISARVLHLEKDTANCYVFDNYPLDVVFDQLQVIYNTKITYNKAELGNRTFIGKIDGKDPLYHILSSIGLLNSFGLHKDGDGFVIGN
jgi:transmembrane sensor